MELPETMLHRRSVRLYTGAPIPEDQLKKIILAGLSSASGRGRRPWELYVVTEPEKLHALAGCRIGSAAMLEKAGAAIVVFADSAVSDTWIEDCSIVMTNMHLMADSLGLGSCWIQGRMRTTVGDVTTEDYIKKALDIPEGLVLEAALAIGVADEAHRPAARMEAELPAEKVHFI